MTHFHASNLQVGDKAAAIRWSRGTMMSGRVGEVVAVNKWGHITMRFENGNEQKFDKYGDLYKSSYGPRLFAVEVYERVAAEQKKKQSIRATVSVMIDIIQDAKNGYGDYMLDEEDVDQLQEKLNKLREVVK